MVLSLSATDFAATKFDYLVVGGGTAGLAVAARLSEDAFRTVGVIEGGLYVPDMPEINIPGLFGRSLGNTTVDWAYSTIPQPELFNRSIFVPRGKVLGGSSALNYMVLGRGSEDEYNEWEKLGNPGWNWKSLLGYIKKSETMHPSPPADVRKYGVDFNRNFHGNAGPIQKSFPKWFSPLHIPFFDALRGRRIKANPDPAGGDNTGFATTTISVDPRTATRSYSMTGYLQPRLNQKNLIVLTGAQATKVYFNSNKDKDGRLIATTVGFVKDGRTFNATACKEIVLSAGSIQSPQLLENSGIGNKNILSKFGIKTLVDLPGVGENLQDHTIIPITVEVDSKLETLDQLGDPTWFAQQMDLFKRQQGQLTSIHTAYAFLSIPQFLNTSQNANFNTLLNSRKVIDYQKDYPQKYKLLKKWLLDPKQAQTELLYYPGAFPNRALPTVPGKKYFTIISANMHPWSAGSTHINSADPIARPTIDYKYLTNPIDTAILTKSVKFTLEVAREGPLKNTFVGYVYPPANAHSDADLEKWVRNFCDTISHPAGTAAMFPRNERGVVDGKLVVYGTANLRVADASVFPFHLSAHPTSTIYAIGEKAADLIKDKYD